MFCKTTVGADALCEIANTITSFWLRCVFAMSAAIVLMDMRLIMHETCTECADFASYTVQCAYFIKYAMVACSVGFGVSSTKGTHAHDEVRLSCNANALDVATTTGCTGSV